MKKLRKVPVGTSEDAAGPRPTAIVDVCGRAEERRPQRLRGTSTLNKITDREVVLSLVS